MYLHGVIFDLDGTLVDSRADITASVNYMRAHYGYAPHSRDAVTSFIGNGAHTLVSRAFAHTSVDIDEAYALFVEYYAQHCADNTTLYPGALSLLNALRDAGYACAIVTNKPGVQTERVLAHLAIRDYFSVVHAGDNPDALKPAPAPLLAACATWECAPENALMVGDHHTDIAAAQAAGMPSIFVTYGYGVRDAYTPTYICDSCEEVHACVIAHAGAFT